MHDILLMSFFSAKTANGFKFFFLKKESNLSLDDSDSNFLLPKKKPPKR